MRQVDSYSSLGKIEVQNGKIWIQIIHNKNLCIRFVSWFENDYIEIRKHDLIVEDKTTKIGLS